MGYLVPMAIAMLERSFAGLERKYTMATWQLR
jgi:hypothetical protein